jgi:ketosteroid isomerase-like protein
MLPGASFATPRMGLVLLAFLLVPPSAGAGQVAPGFRTPSRETIKAQFIDDILKGLEPARVEWSRCVRNDDLNSLMKLYSDDAILVPPNGAPIKGRKLIRQFWEGVLPHIGDIDSGLADVDGSGVMAMIAGAFTLQSTRDDGTSVQRTGSLLTVYVRVDSRWFIRAQTFSGHVPELDEHGTVGRDGGDAGPLRS